MGPLLDWLLAQAQVPAGAVGCWLDSISSGGGAVVWFVLSWICTYGVHWVRWSFSRFPGVGSATWLAVEPCCVHVSAEDWLAMRQDLLGRGNVATWQVGRPGLSVPNGPCGLASCVVDFLVGTRQGCFPDVC